MKNIRSVREMKSATLIVATVAFVLVSGCSAQSDTQSKPAEKIAPTAIKVEIKSGDLFVSADGKSSYSGSQNSPTTLENAITRLPAGNTIWVRGGTYKLPLPITIAVGNNGTSTAPKRLFAYNDEVPVFDFSALPVANSNRGLTLNGNFWHFKGLTIERAGDNGIYIGGSNNTIELCETRFNSDTGLQLGRSSPSLKNISEWPSNNLILNCTSHDNKDPGNENADGFACKLTTGTGNVFRGCVAHHNIDDGWDLFAKKATGPIGPVLIENCIAHHNGTLTDGTTSGGGDKNGFKLGGSGIAVAHIIRDSKAYDNGKHGFTDNNNPGPITVTNNTATHNGESNFKFREGGTHIFTNNTSVEPNESDKTTGTLVGTTNVFWDKKKKK